MYNPLSSLPLSFRISVMSTILHQRFVTTRHSTTWAPFGTFFRRAPVRQSRRFLWLVPVAGGLTVYLYSSSPPLSPNVLASPTIIPCPTPKANSRIYPTIHSPAEPHKHILSRIFTLLYDRIWNPICTGLRFVQLFVLFLPVIVSAPMLLVGAPDKKYYDEKWGALWWYGLLVRQMEAAGPTFIKLAQWAATRADLFPNALCERLGKLHSRGRPHSIDHTKHLIERVFQRRFEDVFEEFDEVPIGTGAIAQVYKATLKKDLIPPSYLGPKRPPKSTVALAPTILNPEPPPSAPTASVAIKILHPGASDKIARDLSIMSFFARCISLFPGMQWLSLPEEVEVFGSMMFQQLDLRHEAENLEVFEGNFAGRGLPLTFPRPLKVWSTKDLMIEEYEVALPLETFMRNGGGPFDLQLATIGLDAFLNMLLLDNFVHSDLHPGNIMVKFTKPLTTTALLKNIWASVVSRSDTSTPPLDSGSSEANEIVMGLRRLAHSPDAWDSELLSISEAGYMPEVVFVDAGLVTTLDAMNRQNFLDLFRAVAQFDGYRAGQLMVERCRTPHLVVDAETFALKMQHIVLSVKRKTFSLGQIKISDVLTQVLKAVRQHHVKLEGDFINTIVSVLLLEGTGRQLDPELDLFKSALPILRQLGRQMGAQEQVGKMPSGNFSALLKVWVWLEARELAAAAFVNADELIKRDWLMPNI